MLSNIDGLILTSGAYPYAAHLKNVILQSLIPVVESDGQPVAVSLILLSVLTTSSSSDDRRDYRAWSSSVVAYLGARLDERTIIAEGFMASKAMRDAGPFLPV